MSGAGSAQDIRPVHPGEILKEEFLEEYGLSQYQLAKSIGVPLPRINAIVRGKRGISADTALRLAKFFNNSPEFWMNLQSHYDLEITELQSKTEIEAAVQVDINELIRDREARDSART